MGEREKRGKERVLSLFSRIRITYTFSSTYYVYVIRIRFSSTYYVYVIRTCTTYTFFFYVLRVLRIRFLVRELRIRFFSWFGWRLGITYTSFFYVLRVLRIRLSSTYYGYYVYVFRRGKGRTGFGAFPRTPYIINVLPLRTYKSGLLVLFATQK